MHNTSATEARLKQFAMSQAPGLTVMLGFALAPTSKLKDPVGLVLGEHSVNGVRRGQMVSIVPRADLSLYITGEDARTIPAGRADALPIFVKDRGASHAFLLPITDELLRSLVPLRRRGAVA